MTYFNNQLDIADENDELFLKDEIDLYPDCVVSPNSVFVFQKNIDEKFNNIQHCYDEKRFTEAGRMIDTILDQAPDHQKSLQLQSQLKQKYHQAEQFYAEIKQGMESENETLKQLLELLKHAMNIFPDHPSGIIVQLKLLNLSRLYKTSVKRGNDAIQNKNWPGALQFFKQAHKIEPGFGILKVKIEHLKKIQQMRHEIDTNIKLGDFEKAQRLALLTDSTIMEIK